MRGVRRSGSRLPSDKRRERSRCAVRETTLLGQPSVFVKLNAVSFCGFLDRAGEHTDLLRVFKFGELNIREYFLELLPRVTEVLRRRHVVRRWFSGTERWEIFGIGGGVAEHCT